jgi:hypothetical protein
MNGKPRFKFAGHAKGFTAHFDRLDETEGLNHVVPLLGESVLPEWGERREDRLSEPYRYDVDAPRQRRLIGIDGLHTWAEGREVNGHFETEVSIKLTGLDVVEMLHIDSVQFHMRSSRTHSTDPVVATDGYHILGMRLGNVEAEVTLDDEVLPSAGTEQQFADLHGRRGKELAKFGDHYRSSIVSKIQLKGEERDQAGMCVDGNVIMWRGFGRIILGEIHVKGHERRVTMLRLAMGSAAGGTAQGADGQSNGQPITP